MPTVLSKSLAFILLNLFRIGSFTKKKKSLRKIIIKQVEYMMKKNIAVINVSVSHCIHNIISFYGREINNYNVLFDEIYSKRCSNIELVIK